MKATETIEYNDTVNRKMNWNIVGWWKRRKYGKNKKMYGLITEMPEAMDEEETQKSWLENWNRQGVGEREEKKVRKTEQVIKNVKV